MFKTNVLTIMTNITKGVLAYFKKKQSRLYLEGLLSFIPGLKNIGLRGTVMSSHELPAKYYYSVWLRHIVTAYENKLNTKIDAVAELGPGDALGLGIMALLTGANQYYAFDVVHYAKNEHNIRIFYELIKLLKNKERIPDNMEFPHVEPLLTSYDFPSHILKDEDLVRSLSPERLHLIEAALKEQIEPDNSIKIEYIVPWNSYKHIRNASLDLIISQAVLEHIDDLNACYTLMAQWLKPHGFISNAIDFRSHGLTETWDGYRQYSGLAWKVIRGRRPFLLNREPYSTHVHLAKKSGFEIISAVQKILSPTISNGYTCPDSTIATAFIQAKRT
jgi:SAM-dependent methyltransferase